MKKILYSILVGVTFEHYFTTEQDLEALVTQMHGNLRTALAMVTKQELIGLRVDVVRQGAEMNKVRELNIDYFLNRSNQQQWRAYYRGFVF